MKKWFQHIFSLDNNSQFKEAIAIFTVNLIINLNVVQTMKNKQYWDMNHNWISQNEINTTPIGNIGNKY